MGKLLDLIRKSENPVTMRGAVEGLEEMGETGVEASMTLMAALKSGAVDVDECYVLKVNENRAAQAF